MICVELRHGLASCHVSQCATLRGLQSAAGLLVDFSVFFITIYKPWGDLNIFGANEILGYRSYMFRDKPEGSESASRLLDQDEWEREELAGVS